MCGRFTLRIDSEAVARAFDARRGDLDHGPRYNISPTDPVAVVRLSEDDGGRELAEARWGLVPHWVDDPDDFDLTLINARSETAPDKPAFRDAFRTRRCLVPADGFYEWVAVDGGKQPFFVHRGDDAPFAFAGLWDRWRGPGDRRLESATILTCEPDEVVGELHDRMPVVLPPDRWDAWMDPASEPRAVQELLRPRERNETAFEAHPVSRDVNRPDRDGPELVEPVADER
jgi:putative SOS response-associated peptidase YedK